MSGRPLNPATSTALGAKVVYDAWLFRLDIEGDPVIVWTGPRDVSFAGTGDPALEGVLFVGMGNIGDIGQIVDGRGGSQAVQLRLPGINLADEALRQVVFNENRWQKRSAWIWIATLDENYNIVGVPFRVKTGRMDQMRVGQGRGQNFVQVTIESHQAYASIATNTKYSEQKDIDPTDTSQDYVQDLANRTAIIGGTVTNNASRTAAATGVNFLLGGGHNFDVASRVLV